MTRRGDSTRAPAKKRFGQHFLTDPNILRRIVDAADLTPDDLVVEIGPGRGALTAELASRARRVVAVEIDRDLVRELRARFDDADNVSIVEGDVLETPVTAVLEQVGERPPYVVVANLPYNVAAAVLRHFLEADAPPTRLVVMVQLEVAEAIVARPREMSLLSVATQVYGETRMVMKLAPGAFSPRPKVRSAVVRIDVSPTPRVSVPMDQFFSIVRAGFGNPRKQLRNSIANGMGIEGAEAERVLRAAEMDPSRRAQTLTIEEWERITRTWMERGEE